MVHKNELSGYKDSTVNANVNPRGSPLTVRLEDRDLWMRFFGKTNEMIVTRSGRNMFPVIKVGLSGLDPTTIYEVVVDFQQINNHKWKYINGEWQQGTKPDPVQLKCEYKHPDSPNFGAHWMKDSLSFNKVKLTNKPPNKGQIQLNSLHKYEPRIVIYRLNTNLREKVAEASFHETQFIAVTAYQNEEITSLKIRHNPFAKAFLDVRENRPEREQNGQEDYLEEPHGAYANGANLYGYGVLPGANTLVTVAPQASVQGLTGGSSISSSTSASPEAYYNRPQLPINLTPNTFFLKEEHKSYTLPCPQNQHQSGGVDRYSRHSSSRSTPYSSGYHYGGQQNSHQSSSAGMLNYSQDTEGNGSSVSAPSPPLIAAGNTQFLTSGLSPRGNLLLPVSGTNHLQTPSQSSQLDSNANTFDTWSSSASTSSTSSQKINDSLLNTSSPLASSNSSPTGTTPNASIVNTQFFNPTTSSSPLNQQHIPYTDMHQGYHVQNKNYWSNGYHSNYISSQFNQHHHNYALAALAAANYHPQLSISPPNQLNQNTNNGGDLKSEQFHTTSPTGHFYSDNNSSGENQGQSMGCSSKAPSTSNGLIIPTKRQTELRLNSLIDNHFSTL